MRKKYLISIALFSMLFMLFILLGCLLWSWQSPRMAIVCFVLALPAVFGQLFSIVLLSRAEYQPNKYRNNPDTSDNKEINHE